MRNRLSFAIDDLGDRLLAVTPRIDGRRLTDVVTDYYADRAAEAGSHGGLVPAYFPYGPLDAYFLGRDSRPLDLTDPHRIFLLGCTCGEVGCNPLQCAVEVAADTVTWHGFSHDNPDLDMTGLGPFEFDRRQYEEAIAALMAPELDWT